MRANASATVAFGCKGITGAEMYSLTLTNSIGASQNPPLDVPAFRLRRDPRNSLDSLIDSHLCPVRHPVNGVLVN